MWDKSKKKTTEGGIRDERTFTGGMREKYFRWELDLLILTDGMPVIVLQLMAG